MHTQQPQTSKSHLQMGATMFNHGGHEVNDMHEVLGSMIGVLEQYVLYRDYIQDQELRQIWDNQYPFLVDEYNMLVQAFSTGKDPSHGTLRYQMTQNNDSIIYGLKPTAQPKTPKQNANEINCACISAFMLSQLKGIAGQKTIAAFEVTNPVVRRVLQDSIPNTIEMGYEIALWQNKQGHYQIPQYSQQDMQQILHSYGPAPTQGIPNMPNTRH